MEQMIGSKLSAFENRLDSISTTYKCDEADMDNYEDQQDFSSMIRCIGIMEAVSLNIIDEMF